MQPREGAATEEDAADGAKRQFIRDADELAGSGSFDGHLGNNGYAQARADHTDEAAELAAFKRDLRMNAGAGAGRDGCVAEAVAVTKQEKWLRAEILEEDRGPFGQAMMLGDNYEKAFG